MVAALTCGVRRFSLSISECARDAPKFDGARASKIFCVKRRTCGVGNLGRLRAKIFASGVQFNVLQHDATFEIKSEALNIQFNMVQHDRSVF